MKNTNFPFNVMRHRNQFEIAPREPITIGNAVLAFIGASTSSLAVLYAVGVVTIAVVASAVAGAVMPNIPDFGGLNNSGTLLQNRKDALPPAEFVYGEVRKGGTVTFLESTGTDNKILHQIIVLAAHEVEAIEEIYFNDEVVTMSNELVTSSPYSKSYSKRVVTSYDQHGDPIYGDGQVTEYYARVFKHTGNQTDANSPFANSTASLANTLHSASGISVDSDFIGKGLAYIYCQFTYNQDVFSGGLPIVTAKIKGKKIVKTVNGVNQTAAYSNNAAWCIKDYLQSNYGLGDNSIDYSTFEAAAEICDDTTVLSDGTPQFTMNGVIGGAESRGNILQRMMTTCGGTLFWGAGYWRLYAGDWTPPTKTLTMDDFRSGIQMDTKISMRDNFNAVRGTFVDAANDFISSDYPQVSSDYFLAEDNNIETVLDLNLPFTTNPLAAQRIAKQLLMRNREQLTLSADFGMNAFDVQVGDFIYIQNERYNWGVGNEKSFEVIGWRLQPDVEGGDLRVNLTLRESSQAAFGFTNFDEQTIITNNTTLPRYYDVPNISLSVTKEYREVNESVVNVLIVRVNSADIERISSVILKYKKSDDNVYKSVSQTILINEGTTAGRFEIVGVDAPVSGGSGINYDISVTPVNSLGFKGEETSVVHTVNPDTTPPSPPSTLSHILSGGTLFFEWDAVTDIDLSHYKLYYNSNTSETFGNSRSLSNLKVKKIARPATSITYPSLAGKWFISAVDKSGNESTTAPDTTVLASELPALNETKTTNEHPLFSGQGLSGSSNVTFSSNSLEMNSYSSANAQGIYQFWHEDSSNHYIDIGLTPRTVRLSSSFTATRKHLDAVNGEVTWDDIPGNWDTWPGNMDDWTDQETDFGDFAVVVQARASDTVSGLTTETYVVAAGEVVGRYVQFRAILSNTNAKVTPDVTALSAIVEY